MADEAKNMGGLRKSERSRMLIIIGVVVAVGIFLLAFVSLRHKAPVRQSGTEAEVALPSAPSVKAIPGTSDAPQHTQLLNQANQQGASDATANNTSFVPIIVANNNGAGADPFDLARQKGAAGAQSASAAVATAPVVVAQPVQPVVVAPVVQQQSPVVDAEQRARVNQREQLMAGAMQKLLDGWVPGTQAMETDYTGQSRQQGGTAAAGTATGGSAQSAANAAAVTASSSQNAADATPLIKAASIIPAVLMTSINSDEPGPVLAQLVTGPFEGARALGTFTKPDRGEKAVLQFTMLSIPGAQGRTLTINAFAVDPESARTALATDVDHHYLSRYGLLAASAFLSGYGNALQTSGGTQTQGLYGTQTTYPQINTAQKAFVALGQVGQVAGTQLQSEFNRPVTVKVEQGTPMGLLFMTDVMEKH